MDDDNRTILCHGIAQPAPMHIVALRLPGPSRSHGRHTHSVHITAETLARMCGTVATDPDLLMITQIGVRMKAPPSSTFECGIDVTDGTGKDICTAAVAIRQVGADCTEYDGIADNHDVTWLGVHCDPTMTGDNHAAGVERLKSRHARWTNKDTGRLHVPESAAAGIDGITRADTGETVVMVPTHSADGRPNSVRMIIDRHPDIEKRVYAPGKRVEVDGKIKMDPVHYAKYRDAIEAKLTITSALRDGVTLELDAFNGGNQASIGLTLHVQRSPLCEGQHTVAELQAGAGAVSLAQTLFGEECKISVTPETPGSGDAAPATTAAP